MRRERGALEVRLDARQGVAEAGLDRRGAACARGRRGRSTRRGARPRRCRAPTAGRRASRPTGRRASARPSTRSTLLRLSRPWEMPARVQPVDLPHQVDERLVAHLVGARELERLDVGLARDHERVAVRAEGGDDDLGYADTGLRGHEERERLVLDLLQAADGRASRRVAVGEEPPAPSEPLRVLRVAAEHAYLERTTVSVATEVLRVADAAAARPGQGRSPGRRAPPARRPHAPSAARPRPSRTQAARARQRRGRARARQALLTGARSRAPRRPPSRRGPQPGGEHPGPVYELRAGDDEDRGRRCETELGVAPARQQVIVDRKPVGHGDPTRTTLSPATRSSPTSRSRARLQRRHRSHVEDNDERESERARRTTTRHSGSAHPGP